MTAVLLPALAFCLGAVAGWWLKRWRSNTNRESTHRMPLVRLVTAGTLLVTLLGVLLFGWLAWLLGHQPAPWHDPNGWNGWISHVNGTSMFDAARTTATILAIIGVGGAALVAYRRQDTAERAHTVAIAAQETAAQQFALDSDKYELDRQSHQLETDRRTDDRERELRSRFTTIAEQLGSDNYSVRHAGAYALASLADDWHRFGNDSERQVCVDLLCAQLRTPRQQIDVYDEEDGPRNGAALTDSPQDLEVRKTIAALIRSHRPLNATPDDGWKSCSLDLSGANLSGFNFYETDFSSANLDDANLSGTNLIRADLSESMMTRARLNAADLSNANLTGAKLFSAVAVDLHDSQQYQAVFSRATLQDAYLTSARLPNAEFNDANLQGAVIHNANLQAATFNRANLAGARLNHSNVTQAKFEYADLRATNFAYAEVEGANFTQARYNNRTNWANGVIPEDVAPIDEA